MDGLDMRLDANQAQRQSPVISFRQIAAVRLLQLSSQELETSISHEQLENPAFEAETRPCCPQCNATLDSPLAPCPVCGARGAQDETTPERTRDELNDRDGMDSLDGWDAPASGQGMADDADDPMMRLSAPAASGAALLQSLCLSIADEDVEIAEYLVGSLDHHGFLPANIVDDAADALCCDADRVEDVLAALQRLDPPGVGARGAQECLLIQLQRLREAGHSHSLAEMLVRDHLKELAFRHFREVAHTIGQTPRRIEEEWEFIRQELYPYPAHGFDAETNHLAQPAAPVRPDVVIRRVGDTYLAEVVERNRYSLRVNAEYLWARKQFATLGDEASRTHIRTFVDQAQTFISALRQRWETMQRVSDALLELQQNFLEHGQSALKPLTRADVARHIELHESTVSRATDGKFALLPDGRVISFDDFFDASLPIKKALREVIGSESPRRPYSDEQLARLLARQGIVIARRTIAKYREELGILPSRLRRSRAENTTPTALVARTKTRAAAAPSLVAAAR